MFLLRCLQARTEDAGFFDVEIFVLLVELRCGALFSELQFRLTLASMEALPFEHLARVRGDGPDGFYFFLKPVYLGFFEASSVATAGEPKERDAKKGPH